MLTRSLMHQLGTMASQVDVPEEDLRQGRAAPGWETVASNTNAVRMIQIRSSKSKPTDAFVSIEYHGHWYWIDDRDLKSKRVLLLHDDALHAGGHRRKREPAPDHHPGPVAARAKLTTDY